MKDYSDLITSKDDWLIVTALRGPDDECNAADSIKDITTAVVRYLAGFQHRSTIDWYGIFGQRVSSPEDAKDNYATTYIHNKERIVEWLRANWHGHFMMHTCAALNALGPAGKAHACWLEAITFS